jgi:UDP-N-acetylmuramate dehydrogenase
MTTSAVARVLELLGDLAVKDHPIGPLTTYRVGGDAAGFVLIEDEAGLELVAGAVAESGVAVLALGKGSNLLIADVGFAGLVVQLGEGFSSIDLDAGAARAVAGAGAAYPVLARRSAAAGLAGLEWAVGVPGSVGGAVRMNAGGHGSETASSLVSARVVDLATGADGVVAASGLELSYRHSSIADHQLVVTASFALQPGEKGACEAQISEVVRWRRRSQPGGQNAGSVFTNPPGESAGRLVDVAGLKGMRIGSAEVSRKHANFIQADAGGSADDVARLIAEVQRLVEQRLAVTLIPEVRMIGFAT